jgi:hypothetical protein
MNVIIASKQRQYIIRLQLPPIAVLVAFSLRKIINIIITMKNKNTVTIIYIRTYMEKNRDISIYIHKYKQIYL